MGSMKTVSDAVVGQKKHNKLLNSPHNNMSWLLDETFIYIYTLTEQEIMSSSASGM